MPADSTSRTSAMLKHFQADVRRRTAAAPEPSVALTSNDKRPPHFRQETVDNKEGRPSGPLLDATSDQRMSRKSGNRFSDQDMRRGKVSQSEGIHGIGTTR